MAEEKNALHVDTIQRIEFRFRGVKKTHAAGIAGVIDQVMKPIGPQLRQRLLKGADKSVKGIGFAGAEGQRNRPGAQCFNTFNHLIRLGKMRVIGQYHIHAALSQRFNGRAPQAATAACHQGNFCAIVHVSPFLLC